MEYKVINLDEEIVRDMMFWLGDRVIKSIEFHDDGCIDVKIDPEITILKINDGKLTVDRGGKLFTIPHEYYSRIEII